MNKIIKCYLALIIIVVTVLNGCKKEAVPVLTTTALSNITAITATSGGNITDEGSATVISRGVCWSTGITPTIADNKTTDGAGAGNFSSNMTDLNGATIYYVRAYATNTAGTGYGMPISFATLGQSPTPTIASATNINIMSATLNGSINANYLSTIVNFEYGTTTSYGSIVTATQSPVTGNTSTNVNADITGLTSGTTYHYRIKAVNSLGTTYSNDITFTTLGQVPTVTTLVATNINATGVTLNGSVNADYLSTVVTFEYGITTSYSNTVTATQSPVTGNAITNVSANITGLTVATIYHFRIKAVNSLGTTYGDDLTFTTVGQVPTVTTLAATNINITVATLNGSANANYSSTLVTFEYGTTTNYGSIATATQSPVTGNAITNVSANITGLIAATIYHYRIKAVNSFGTTYGSDLTFTTISSNIVTDIDGNIYNTITIGTQVWMKENLKTTKYNNGDLIGTTTPATLDISSESTPKYQWACNGNESNVVTYGRLYTWYAVADNRNVCPTGWHVPTKDEWEILTNYIASNGYGYGGSVYNIAKSMASTSGWQTFGVAGTVGNDQSSNNTTSFTALPAGDRNYSYFNSLGTFAVWWSSTEWNTTQSYLRVIEYQNSDVGGSMDVKSYGYSVRCLRNF